MLVKRSQAGLYLAAAVLGLSSVLWAQGRQEDVDRREKVALSMRVSPAIAFSPARVSATAELRGEPQPEDEARLYCAAIEWDWGDGTRSESQYDCEPYENGKSTLKRRYNAVHTYNYAGRYRIQMRLKRNQRTLLATNTSVQIRPGARDWGGQ
jgi:hypothetical protein